MVIWKKRSKIKFLFVLAFILFNYTVSFAKEDSKAELTFTLTKGKEAIITGGEVGEQLLIPKSIEGYPVVGIGDNAFENQTEIRRIMIDEEVRHIGEYAFAGCDNLETIIFPESLQYLGDYSFAGAVRLREVDLPKTLLYIGEFAFGECKELIKIKLPSVANIDDYAFEGSRWQNERDKEGNMSIRGSTGVLAKDEGQERIMNIPYGITHLEHHFNSYYCWGMEAHDNGSREVILPETLIEIGVGAFEGLAIQKISIPKGIEMIPSEFVSNSLVEEVQFEEESRVKEIGICAFQGIPIVSIELPNSVEVIGVRAFSNCDKLIQITIPESVREIKHGAFIECKNLREVSFHEGLLEIEDSAFSNCTLERIQFPESLKVIKGDNLYLESLNRIYIPSQTKVDENLFHYYLQKDKFLVVYGQSGSDAEKAATAAGLPFIEVEEGKDMP